MTQVSGTASDSDSSPPEMPTPRMRSWARNSTIYRLGRRMHTEKQLFDAIIRKAREKFDPISESQANALAAHAVEYAYENKLLDDRAYAEISSRSGMRSGRSSRAIALKLSQKGVEKETVAIAAAEVDDLYAAVVLARKRAFGPFRKVDLDEKRKAKELAVFARGGFGFDIGKTVFAMTLIEAEDILEKGRHL